jgi:prepilin-type N-terminal cleavage/methylation domain-containing protein
MSPGETTLRSSVKKNGFTPLEGVPAGRCDRVGCAVLTGFTLLEILVAVAIIVGILAMVYGSYFATARSAEAYETKMELSGQVRQVLAEMARQIRCTYAPRVLDRPEEAQQNAGGPGKSREPEESILQPTETVSKPAPNYFSGNLGGLGGEVLHLVTTARSAVGQEPASGLFEVAYRLDMGSGVLYFSQQRFVPALDSRLKSRDWQPVLDGVEQLELTFFDGHDWLRRWDFKDKRRAPRAVRLDVTCRDENYRRCQYTTVACIPCQTDHRTETASKRSLAVNR